MHWKEIDAHHIQSDKGYRITKGAEGAAGRYAAWGPHAKTELPALAFTPTVKEAMRVCEDHFNNQRR